jgi:hypothetical protein
MEATPELGREQGGQGSGRAAKIGPTASATQDVNKQTQQVDSTSRLNKQTQQADSTSRLTRVAWPLSPLAHLFVCSRSRNVQRSVSGVKSQGSTMPCKLHVPSWPWDRAWRKPPAGTAVRPQGRARSRPHTVTNRGGRRAPARGSTLASSPPLSAAALHGHGRGGGI